MEACTGELGLALKRQTLEAQSLLAILEGREEAEAQAFSLVKAGS